MEILAGPYVTGMLACVSVIKNVIKIRDAFGLKFQAIKRKDFSLSHFWQTAN